MEHHRIEHVLTELKKLVGWGCHPKRLPYLPHLRELSGVDEDEDTSLVTMGGIIYQWVVDQIESMTGTYPFMGQEIEADRIKRAYKLLLKVEHRRGKNAEDRRGRVIMLLSLNHYFSVETWRRAHGPERDFLRILAHHMVYQTPTS